MSTDPELDRGPPTPDELLSHHGPFILKLFESLSCVPMGVFQPHIHYEMYIGVKRIASKNLGNGTLHNGCLETAEHRRALTSPFASAYRDEEYWAENKYCRLYAVRKAESTDRDTPTPEMRFIVLYAKSANNSNSSNAATSSGLVHAEECFWVYSGQDLSNPDPAIVTSLCLLSTFFILEGDLFQMEHFRRFHSEYPTALSMESICSFYGAQFVKRDAPYCYDPVLCINLHKIKVKKDAKKEREEESSRAVSLDVDLSVISPSSSVSSSPRSNERQDGGVSSPRQDKHSRLQRIMTKRAEGTTGNAASSVVGSVIPSEALSTCPPSSTHYATDNVNSGLGFLTNPSPRMNRAPVQRSFTSTPTSGNVVASDESEQGKEGRQGKKFEKSLTIGSKSPTRIATTKNNYSGNLQGPQFRSKPINRMSRDDHDVAYVARGPISASNDKTVSKERRPLRPVVEKQQGKELPSRDETTQHVPDCEKIESSEPVRVRAVAVLDEGRQPRSPERRPRGAESEKERERRMRRPSISSPPAMDEERLQAHLETKERAEDDRGRERVEEQANADAATSSKLTQSQSESQPGRTDNGTRVRRERAEARSEKSDKEEPNERPEPVNKPPERALLSFSPTRVRFDEKEKEREQTFVLASPRDERASSPRVRAPVQRNRTIGANKSPNNSNSYEINSKTSVNSATDEAVKPIENFDSVHSSIEQLESYLLMQRTFKEEADCNDATTNSLSEPSADSHSTEPNPLNNNSSDLNASDDALGHLLAQMNRNFTSGKKGTVRMDPVSPRRNMYRAEVDPSSLDKKFEKIVSFQTQIKSPRTLRNEREAQGLHQPSPSQPLSNSPAPSPSSLDSTQAVSAEAFGTARRPNPWYNQLFASSEATMKIPENVDVMAYLDEYYERHLKSKESSEPQENAL